MGYQHYLLFLLFYGVRRTLSDCGQFSGNGTVPWNVGIHLGDAKLICMGTAIQPNIILTAAHCFCDNLSGQIRNITFHLLQGDQPSIQVIIEILGKIFQVVFQNDLAIIKINEKTYSPVCLDWNSDIDEGLEGKQVIWSSDKLTIEKQNDKSKEHCQQGNFQSYMTPDKACAQLSNTKGSHASEGGAIFFEYESKWYIKGVVSMHDVIHGLTTYTHVKQYLNWISNFAV